MTNATATAAATHEDADHTVRIPNIAGWINANDRTGGHLFHRQRLLVEAWRKAGQYQAEQANLPRLDRAYVVAELGFVNRRRRDPGNFYPTAKAAVDGLVDAGMLVDDSTEYLIGPDMRLGPPCPTHKGQLTLHIYALPPAGEEGKP